MTDPVFEEMVDAATAKAAKAKALSFGIALAHAYQAEDGQQIHDLIHSRPDEVAVFLDLVSAINTLMEQLGDARRSAA